MNQLPCIDDGRSSVPCCLCLQDGCGCWCRGIGGVTACRSKFRVLITSHISYPCLFSVLKVAGLGLFEEFSVFQLSSELQVNIKQLRTPAFGIWETLLDAMLHDLSLLSPMATMKQDTNCSSVNLMLPSELIHCQLVCKKKKLNELPYVSFLVESLKASG